MINPPTEAPNVRENVTEFEVLGVLLGAAVGVLLGAAVGVLLGAAVGVLLGQAVGENVHSGA